MKLSKRLEMVVSFAKREPEKDGVYRIADVGTDHGYVPIALARSSPAVRAVAMDIRPGPLKRAGEHVGYYGLEQQIQLRLSDGVEKLAPGEAETVVVAGMGGELVIHILEGGRHLWKLVKRWILSPQSELDKVRKYLEDQGFAITREGMVEEEGKYYTVMEVTVKEDFQTVQEQTQTTDHELAQARYLYGPRLIEEKNPVLAEFLKREEGQLTEILKGLETRTGLRAQARQEELRQKLSWVKRAMTEMREKGESI